MNSAWLLKSSTLWGALAFSCVATTFILLFSPDGLPSLRKRESELRDYLVELRQKNQQNRELALEVRRLATKDPELLEALARRQGYARPGETIYTFRETGENR
jgi:cell division protein FtsB